jgi:hypothetical protein
VVLELADTLEGRSEVIKVFKHGATGWKTSD